MSVLIAYAKFIQQALKYGFSLFGLPKTGQVIEYLANDDGAYKKGYPKKPPRFKDNGDGTITDMATGLMWVKVGNGPGCNNGVALAWSAAIAFCEGLNFAEHTDWRLPNIKELASIIDYSQKTPAIDLSFFPNTVSGDYWSGTTCIVSIDNAWFNRLSDGGVRYVVKTGSCYVRPVRGGV